MGGDTPGVLVVRAVDPDGWDSIGRSLLIRSSAAIIPRKYQRLQGYKLDREASTRQVDSIAT